MVELPGRSPAVGAAGAGRRLFRWGVAVLAGRVGVRPRVRGGEFLMVDVRVTVTINSGEWARMMSSEGIVGRAVRNAADTTVRRARSNILRSGRVRTGRMLR